MRVRKPLTRVCIDRRLLRGFRILLPNFIGNLLDKGILLGNTSPNFLARKALSYRANLMQNKGGFDADICAVSKANQNGALTHTIDTALTLLNPHTDAHEVFLIRGEVSRAAILTVIVLFLIRINTEGIEVVKERFFIVLGRENHALNPGHLNLFHTDVALCMLDRSELEVTLLEGSINFFLIPGVELVNLIQQVVAVDNRVRELRGECIFREGNPARRIDRAALHDNGVKNLFVGLESILDAVRRVIRDNCINVDRLALIEVDYLTVFDFDVRAEDTSLKLLQGTRCPVNVSRNDTVSNLEIQAFLDALADCKQNFQVRVRVLELGNQVLARGIVISRNVLVLGMCKEVTGT